MSEIQLEFLDLKILANPMILQLTLDGRNQLFYHVGFRVKIRLCLAPILY